jgi:hypothetical protein
MAGKLVCDRCGATYTNKESIEKVRELKDRWAKQCREDGAKPRGWFGCLRISCPGELIYKEE